MLAISIILLVLEVIVGFLFFHSVIKNRKTTRETFVSFLGILLINFSIFVISFVYCYAVLKLDRKVFIDIANSIFGLIRLFGFNFFEEMVLLTCENNPLFSLVVAIGSLLAITTTVTATLTFFNAKMFNYFNYKKLLKQETCDLVIGCEDFELNYAKTTKNCILFVKEDTSKEEINSLIDDGYVVISKNFELDVLKSKLFNKTTKYHFVYFGEDEKLDKSIEYIKTFKALLKDKQHYNFYLHIGTNYNKSETLRTKLIEPHKFNANIITFSKEEYLCRDIVEKIPLTKYLPEGFINDDCTINNKKVINVFILGFDSVHEELTKALIMNNQLVKIEKDKYTPFIVNYYIIDEDINKKHVYQFVNINHKLNKVIANKDQYFEPYYELANVVLKDLNPYGQETLDFIESHIENQNSFNYIYISSANDYEGINFTEKLFVEFSEENYYLINKTQHLDLVRNDEVKRNVTYYGDYHQILTHDVIVDEKLSTLAINCNLAYNEKVDQNSILNWNSMSFINIYSNIYASINIRLKLNLLGYDYDKYDHIELSSIVTEQEYFKRYTNDKIVKENKKYVFDTTYENYFVKNRRNALIYQEHLRWNAFYLLNGYSPLKKEKVDFVEGKIYNKDHSKKLHSCITSFEGLDKLSVHLSDISFKHDGKQYSVTDFDYYKYDANTSEIAYFVLKKLGYGIYKK